MSEIMHMSGMIMFLSLLISFAITFLHYEALSLLTNILTNINNVKRIHILFAMFAVTLLHIISILIYAGIYYIMINEWGIGHLEGMDVTTFEDYAYYSITVYTSLGFGDVLPVGGLRFFSGLETLNGLALMAWSASYSYLLMSKYWIFKNPNMEIDFK